MRRSVLVLCYNETICRIINKNIICRFKYHNSYIVFVQTRCEQVRTASCSTRSNSSREKRMLPTTTLAATTPSGRRSWTSSWTVFASFPTSVPVFRGSWCSTPLAGAPARASLPSSWSGSPWITARRASSSSPSIPLHRYQPLVAPIYRTGNIRFSTRGELWIPLGLGAVY